jgi:hypothetical protein
LLAGLSSPTAAHLPPVPPPDPATLEATRQLVEQLPIGDLSPFQSIEQANAKRAVNWARRAEPKLLADPELERLFSAKVEQEARATAIPACIPEAKEALAAWYARRLRADDARQITTLLNSEIGTRLSHFLQTGDFLATLTDCAYRDLFPRLPAILASAVESNDLRRTANSGSASAP